MTVARAVAVRVGAAFAASWGYALVRYVGFKGVPWREVPLYVTDKAVAVTAAVLVGLALVPPRLRTPEQQAVRRGVGVAGAALGLLHAVMTVPLFADPVFDPLFEGGALGARGWAVTVLGVLAVAPCLAMLWLSRSPGVGAAARATLRRLGWLVVVLTAAHSAAVGAENWLAPRSWPAALPPMTLLVDLILAAFALKSLRATPRADAAPGD